MRHLQEFIQWQTDLVTNDSPFFSFITFFVPDKNNRQGPAIPGFNAPLRKGEALGRGGSEETGKEILLKK